MEPETAAALLWDYARWLTGKEETFQWTRRELACACELAGRTMDAADAVPVKLTFAKLPAGLNVCGTTPT